MCGTSLVCIVALILCVCIVALILCGCILAVITLTLVPTYLSTP